MNATKICGKGDLQALMTLLLPVDLEGSPFWLDKNPMHADQATIEFYACDSCLEQFSNWDDAIAHLEAK